LAAKSLRNTEKMKLIHELKDMGIPQSEVEEAFKARGLKAPSKPTIRKYYNRNEGLSTEDMTEAYAKEKAFEEPHCKQIILRTFEVNGPEITVSSIYDLLQEKLVATGILEALPGNEQTLRNYCRHLKQEGLIQTAKSRKKNRVYDEVVTPEPGKQMQLDYGVLKIRNNEHFHFIALLLRHSRMLFVKAQDHHFNAVETCNAIYGFFILLGGRVQQLVIDQDTCLIYEETYGEITTTRVFGDFVREQNLDLYVCKKADPESKGAILLSA
jgi:DNA-binding transcriptional MerR regulator